jgi:hypothetical protein
VNDRREAFALLRARPQLTLGVVLWLMIAPFLVRRFRARVGKENFVGRVCFGDCLRPWLVNADLLLFDTARTPRDGDLVVTKTSGTLRAGFCGTKAREIELYGAKQLRVGPGGRRWLASADGAYPADDPDGVGHEIVGVATHVARRPWRKLPPMADLRFPIRRATVLY